MAPIQINFDELLKCYQELLCEEQAIRKQLLGLEKLDLIIKRQYQLIETAPSRLSVKGPAAERLIIALASPDNIEAGLAASILMQFQPFPKRFVGPMVRYLVLHRREERLYKITGMYGKQKVLDELYLMAKESYFNKLSFSLVSYYLGPYTKYDDAALCRTTLQLIEDEIQLHKVGKDISSNKHLE